jgi:hypothetical protein
MSQMGMDCQMPHQIAGTGCGQNCCHNAFPQGIVPSASGAKPKAFRTAHFALITPAATDCGYGLCGRAARKRYAAAPARYILFQVFRI